MSEKAKYSNFRGFKKISVYRIEINEGEGTPEDPLYREVYYCLEDGRIIGHESSEDLRMYAGG